MREFYEAFGKILRNIRTNVAHLTQAQLADRVGLSRSSIANIEKGRHQIPLHVLADLARALGVTPAELIPASSHETDARLAIEAMQAKGVPQQLIERVARHLKAEEASDEPEPNR